MVKVVSDQLAPHLRILRGQLAGYDMVNHVLQITFRWVILQLHQLHMVMQMKERCIAARFQMQFGIRMNIAGSKGYSYAL